MASELFYKNKKIKSAGFLGAGRSSIAVAEYIKRNHKNVSLILRSDLSIKLEMLSKAVDIIKCTSLDSRENPVVKAGFLV